MILTSNEGVHKSNVVIHRGCFPVSGRHPFLFSAKKYPDTVFDTKGIP